MTRFLFVLTLLLAGCNVCRPDLDFVRPVDADGPWNTTYLMDVDPSIATVSSLSLYADIVDAHYWTYGQVNGIAWPPWRTSATAVLPDRWTNGGDSAIFTGYALAAYCFKYRTTMESEDLDKVMDSLRGLDILTHITGTPGVICRNAFPLDEGVKFGYPDAWGSRIAKGFVGESREDIVDLIRAEFYPQMGYYTRGTKDQLTGIVLGLAAAWRTMDVSAVPPDHAQRVLTARFIIVRMVAALYGHLVEYNWRIRDQHGFNDTSADHVKGLLKVALLGIYRQTVVSSEPNVSPHIAEVNELYKKEFADFIDFSNTLAYADRFNNFDQYYGHNLRVARALSIWLLEDDQPRKQQIEQYLKTNIWRFVRGHKNAWFAFVRATFDPSDAEARAEGLRALKALSFKPLRSWTSPLHDQEEKPGLLAAAFNCTNRWALDAHLRKPTSYFTWQKEPWDVGTGFDLQFDKEGLGSQLGVDYLLPYWLARYRNLIGS